MSNHILFSAKNCSETSCLLYWSFQHTKYEQGFADSFFQKAFRTVDLLSTKREAAHNEVASDSTAATMAANVLVQSVDDP